MVLGLEPTPTLLAALSGPVVLFLVWQLTRERAPPIPLFPKPYGHKRKGGKGNKETELWHHEAVDDLMTESDGGCKTAHDILERSVRLHGAKLGVGQRRLIHTHYEEIKGKKFEKLELAGSYDWVTYNEYAQRVKDFASGLMKFGALKPGDRIVIFAETQRDWLVAAFAAFSQSLTVVTVYATLGEEGAMHGINQTKASLVVCDAKLMKTLNAVVKDCPKLTHVITIGDRAVTAHDSLKHATMEAVVAQGKASPLKAKPPSPDDLAVIMFTSGTTGRPKGVMISHRNIAATVGACQHHFRPVLHHDRYLAYLPLAHIMELCVELVMFSLGVEVGYGNPHTLTDTGVKLFKGCKGDAPALQPTFMVFAPAVLDKVYNAVQGKVALGGGLKKKLFDKALQAGYANFDNGKVGAPWLYNLLVFKKIQKVLGGRVRVMATGSAPLSTEIQKYVQTVFNCPVRQGYGLTETCAASCLGVLCDNTPSQVGPPGRSCMIRLVDWPEGNYLNKDQDNPAIAMARGEVLIGGPSVSLGYLVDPDDPDKDVEEKNKTDYSELNGVRFFHTGDIGQITPDGVLQIVDRKKDLFKGPQGEYVSLSKVESVLKLSRFVDMPMVYGRTGGAFVIALVCPNAHALKQLAADNGIANTDMHALCANKKIADLVLQDCLRLCAEHRLANFELPRKVGLVVDGEGAAAWTPENDLLTAAMKLKRPVIANVHKDLISELYAS